MSEKTNAPDLKVGRNDTVIELTETVFGKKSPNAGKTFYTPVLKLENWDVAVPWFGKEQVCEVVNRAVRKIFGDIATDENNYNEDGTVNWEAMRTDWADFSAGVAKLSDIQEQIDELVDQQQALAMDDNFGATDDNGSKTPRAIELEELIRKCAESIRPLRKQKADIEAKYAARAAKRKAKEVASPTKTA
jgi:hypothetical protein